LRKSIEKAYDIQEDLLMLSDALFTELDIDVENTDFLDFEEFEKVYCGIEDIDDEVGRTQVDELLICISERMIQIALKMRKPISKRKDLLILLNKYSF
jgi:hypothetical protein